MTKIFKAPYQSHLVGDIHRNKIRNEFHALTESTVDQILRICSYKICVTHSTQTKIQMLQNSLIVFRIFQIIQIQEKAEL